MAKIQVRIKVDHVVTFESEDFRDEWEKQCEEDGLEVSPDIPADFAIEKYREDIDNGNADLSEILESAAVDVEAVA